MAESEHIKAVIRMQDYIHQNIGDSLTVEGVCRAAGYSHRHALRLFKKYLNMTVSEYIRDLRLSRSIGRLIEDRGSILDIALDAGFESHEGFSKAFGSRYGVPPREYRKRRFPDGFSAPTPMGYYYLLLRSKGMNAMAESRTVTATFITKPASKFILKRGVKAADYLSFCEEVGCDIWDIFESLPGRLDEPALLIMPDFLMPEGTSKACCGVEVPLDYDGEVPDGCEVIELAEHPMLWFQGMPYEDEEWYCGAHEEVAVAVENYRPELYGWRFAYDEAPEFHYGASAEKGCRRLVPATKI